MSGSGRVPDHLGQIGVAGLLVSFFAAFVQRTPGAADMLLWIFETLSMVLFYFAILLAFVVGLAVIIYSHLKQKHGATERNHRITGIGVCAVLGLSLLFPVVLIDDLLRLVGPLLARYGPDVAMRVYFYAAITIFGTMAFIRLLDIVAHRIRAAHT